MTDSSTAADTAPSRSGDSAGSLLRAARQQQGLHIAALATAIKVTPAKLEALENDRHHELPDLTFVRALTLTVCRQLKIDPAPVLARLPGAPVSGLERVDSGLNTPFRERGGAVDPANWLPWRRPVPWVVGALLVAAAAFVLVPMRGDLLSAPAAGSAAAPQAVMPPAADASAPGGIVVEPAAAPASTPLAPVAVASSAPVPAASSPVVAVPAAPAPVAVGGATDDRAVLRAVQDTWVQASDSGGQVLTSRLIPAGETVELTGRLPLKLRIGNVRGTELSFRGQPVNLAASARDNVANLSLP